MHSYSIANFFAVVLRVSDPGSNFTFRGFFIQAKLVADGSDIGGFTTPLGSGREYRLSSCSPPTVSIMAAIGHSIVQVYMHNNAPKVQMGRHYTVHI